MKLTIVRIFSFSIVAIVFGFLFGCTSLPTSLPTATPSPTKVITPPVFPSTFTPAPSATPDTRFDLPTVNTLSVTLWHPWTGAKGEALAELIQEFNTTNQYGVKIQNIAWGGLAELEDALKTKELPIPGIVVLAPERIQAMNQDIALLDLIPYANSAQAEIQSDSLAAIPPALLEPVKTSAGLLGFPAQVDTPVFVYNRTWANELGYSQAPKSAAEFKDQVCTAARRNNELSDRRMRGTGGWLIDDSNPVNLGWLLSIDDELPFTNEDSATLEGDQIQDALTYAKDLSASGCSWIGKNPTPAQYFFERKALMISLPADKVQAFEIAFKASKSKDEWSLVAFPSPKENPDWTAITTYYAIPKSGNNAENLAAWLVLKWLTDPEIEKTLALSDGSLPATTTNWQTVQEAGTLPPQLVAWMAAAGEPVAVPHLPAWIYAREILQDGFYQTYLSSTSAEDIGSIQEAMQEMLADLEAHYEP